MKRYPISAARDYYRGVNARKREKSEEYNRIAAKVESYINKDLQDKPVDDVYEYLSHSVARAISEDYMTVQRIVFSIDCGHNGVTIYKGDYNKAMSKIMGEEAQ